MSELVAYYTYDALGRRTRVDHGNGAVSYYTYDAASRVTSIYHRKSTGEVIASFDYTHDAAGNPLSMRLANGDTCYYGYDSVYQLTSEVRLDDEDEEVYTQYFEYDAAGNRTALTVSGTLGTGTTYYDYNDADELLAERAPGGTTYYTYDGNGNTVTKDDGTAVSYYAYDAQNLFTGFRKGTDTVYYTYDAASRRTKRVAGQVTEKWVFDNLDSVAQYDENDSLEWQHILSGLDQIVRRIIDTSAYEYLTDHLGSTRAIIDSDQTAVNTYDFDAFGAPPGSPTQSIPNSHLFTGREWDGSIDAYHYRRRQMRPSNGRFLQPDPAIRSHGRNLFSYAENRPTALLDPHGLVAIQYTYTLIWLFAGSEGRFNEWHFKQMGIYRKSIDAYLARSLSRFGITATLRAPRKPKADMYAWVESSDNREVVAELPGVGTLVVGPYDLRTLDDEGEFAVFGKYRAELYGSPDDLIAFVPDRVLPGWNPFEIACAGHSDLSHVIGYGRMGCDNAPLVDILVHEILHHVLEKSVRPEHADPWHDSNGILARTVSDDMSRLGCATLGALKRKGVTDADIDPLAMPKPSWIAPSTSATTRP